MTLKDYATTFDPYVMPASDSTFELFWCATQVDLDAMDRIVEEHFKSHVQERQSLGKGQYARVFCYILENGLRIVARISIPVRETVKTEAEVLAMKLVKCRTDVPVPEVYLYSSSPSNPVGAEWVLMECLPGTVLCDCFEELSYPQKTRFATDLAHLMATLFGITSSYIGCVFPRKGCDERVATRISPRYNAVSGSHDTNKIMSTPAPATIEAIDGRYLIGPVNDVTFLDYPFHIAPELCGPFESEREFIEAFGYRGRPGIRPLNKTHRWPYEKLLEIYDSVRHLYYGTQASLGHSSVYHFAHGDLSPHNILVDAQTGAITGVIDWEMAGFRPPWLSAVAAGWFDDDQERFTHVHYGRSETPVVPYENDTVDDTKLRAHFRVELAKTGGALFRHYWLGVELRAIFYAALENYPLYTEVWIEEYEKKEWSETRRGPFPFDVQRWAYDFVTLQEEKNEGSS